MSDSSRSATSSHAAKASSPPRSASSRTSTRSRSRSAWVARCLADFAGVWDVLTPENRGRLLRAVVQRVEVDEPANQVSGLLADLGADVPAEA